MSTSAFWQEFLFRLSKPFGWLVVLSFWPAALGWLGWWLIPKWFDIPTGFVDLMVGVALICTAAFVFGMIVVILIMLVGWLFWGSQTTHIDEKGRPYPDYVIEAIKHREAIGKRVTERTISKIIYRHESRSRKETKRKSPKAE
jgi:hypothetical protein